jgi:hypothetical protein
VFRHVSLLPEPPDCSSTGNLRHDFHMLPDMPNCSYSSHDCDIRDLPRFEDERRGLRFGEHHTPGVSRRDVTPQVV